MSIRPAASADCEALTRIVRTSRAYEGEYRRIVADVSITDETLRRNVVRVYDAGGRVLGFYSLTCRPHEAELDLMFVADDAGGAGIGRALFADMAQVAKARGYPGVVIVSHPPSVGFYERMGARRVGVKPPGGNATWERPRLWYELSGERLPQR
ncbi:MAG TPA: GNAT family N-acetyltransferase [Thermodesulfobacteriota bacterium]